MAPDCVSFLPSVSSTGASPISLTASRHFGIAGGAVHEVGEHRLPVEAGAIEIERDLVGVAGLAKAMELVLSHGAGVPLGYGLMAPAR